MGNLRAKPEKIYILFFNACGFKENTFLLLNNINHLSTDCNLFSVAVVNGMLAAELYLKFIMAYDNAVKSNTGITEFIKTHDIDELFTNLSSQRKSEIRSRLNELGCDTPQFYKFRIQARKASANSRNNTNKNGDVVNWRYLVVDGKNTYRFDINTMAKFDEVLYKISQQIINSDFERRKISFPKMSSPALDTYSEDIVDQLYITAFRPKY